MPIPTLKSFLSNLPYYWWRKQEPELAERLALFVQRLENGESLTPQEWQEIYDSPVYAKYLAAIAREFDKVYDALGEVRQSRSIDLAFGHGLTMLARNFGLQRHKPWESDTALRNRLRLRILEITCHGTPEEILNIVSKAIWMWQSQWSGDWNAPQWLNIRGRINIVENEIPFYLDGVYRPAHYLLVVPYEYLTEETWPAFTFGDGTTWEDDNVRGFDAGMWDGRTMLTELADILAVASAAGVYGHIWREGFTFGDGTTWEDDSYAGFDAAPLSDAADTFTWRVRAEWDYPLNQDIVLEGFPIRYIIPHPYMEITVP